VIRDKQHRDNVLLHIAMAWRRYPELRLGQFLHNLPFLATGHHQDLFYLRDEVVAEYCEMILRRKRDVH
jgi:uncharacterized protein YihD (DUF1040 family)